MLSRPPYDAINTEWDAKGKRATWYSRLAGQVRSVASQSPRSDILVLIPLLRLVGCVHAGRVLKSVGINSSEPDRKGNAVKPIRHPEGINYVYRFFAQYASISVATIIRDKYLSSIGTDDLMAQYIKEIKPINRQVQNVPVSAEW